MTTRSKVHQETTPPVTRPRPLVEGPGAPETTWEEIGFAEFPIVTTALKRPAFDTFEFGERIGTNPETGQPLERKWKMTSTEVYGLPRLPDLDVFVALLKLAERHNYERRLIITTAKEICDLSGLTPGGTTYERIRDGLRRFANTLYTAVGVFWNRGAKQPVLSEEWSIVDELRLLPDFQDPAIADGLPPSYVLLGTKFLNRLRIGQLKPLDLALWRQLPPGLAKPVFRYLDKNLHRKDSHEIGLLKLGQRIALTGRYNRAQLRRLYHKPLTSLVDVGFLSDFRFEKTKSADDPEKVVVFPGPRARTRARTSQRPSTTQEPPNDAPRASSVRNSALPEVPPDAITEVVAYFSEVFHGVAKVDATPSELAAAQELVTRCGGSIEDAKASIDLAYKESRHWTPPASNFRAVLTNDFPERGAAHRKEQLERQERAEQERREQEAIEAARRELGAEARQRFEALSDDEREQLVNAQASKLVEMYHRSREWPADRVREWAVGQARIEYQKTNLPTVAQWRAGIRTKPTSSS